MTDFIVEFILFALQLWFWYTIANLFFSFLLYRAEKEAKQDIEKILDRVNEIVHRVKVENHHDNWYWYDADSDRFLAQGATPDEVIDHVKSRFPDHVFLLESNDENKILKLSGPEWKFEKIAVLKD